MARVLSAWLLLLLATACLPAGTPGQDAGLRKKTAREAHPTKITRFFIGDPEKNSGFETGPLHILYSDGTEIVERLPPRKASTQKETVFNAVGFSDVHLADDGETLGWTIDVENCCTSYSVPFSVVVFHDKKVLHTFSQGQMVWSWNFVQDGRQIEAVFGPVHGSDEGDDRTYDVQTGKLLSDKFGGENVVARPL